MKMNDRKSLCHDLLGVIYRHYTVNSCSNCVHLFTQELEWQWNFSLKSESQNYLNFWQIWCLKPRGNVGFKKNIQNFLVWLARVCSVVLDMLTYQQISTQKKKSDWIISFIIEDFKMTKLFKKYRLIWIKPMSVPGHSLVEKESSKVCSCYYRIIYTKHFLL